MLIAGKLPTENLAYKLFNDMLHLYSTSDNRSKRYSESTKKCWAIGYKLFKGRFVRFMSGLRDENNCTSSSRINFVVPSLNILAAKIQGKVDCSKPGIIHTNLDMYANISSSKKKSHKISFDGKNSLFVRFSL